MTLDSLAVALRGMPRSAPMFVRLPDGTLTRVRRVRPVHMAPDGRVLAPGAGEGQGVYSITLEVE